LEWREEEEVRREKDEKQLWIGRSIIGVDKGGPSSEQLTLETCSK